MAEDTIVNPRATEDQTKSISPNAIITTHYLFNSIPQELIDDNVLKIIHLDCFHGDDQVVQSALTLLKRLGTTKSFQYLFAVIKDYPEERQAWALETLYEIGNQEVIPPLLDYFKVSFDETIKSKVLRVLARFGKDNQEIKELILAHTKEELDTSPLRFAAIEALGDIQEVDSLQIVVESINEEIIAAGIRSLSQVKNIESLHLVKRLCTRFKRFSTAIQVELISTLIKLENDYVLELIKTVFQDGEEKEIVDLFTIIEESDYLRSYPIRTTKMYLRMPEYRDEFEEKIITSFANYYDSFPDVSNKVSIEIAESIESLLRSYFAKFKTNYQKEYKPNIALKTKIEQDLFYAKEFLEKLANEELVHSLSDYLKNDNHSPNNPKYQKLKIQIASFAKQLKGDYLVNVRAILSLLESTDKLERTRVSAFLNTVDFKKKTHINRLHRLLSFISITKSKRGMDLCYEIFRWGLQLQDRRLMETAILALGRSGHKVLVKEAEKNILPMNDIKLRMICITALGELRHKDGVPVITNFFETHSFDEDIYIATIEALKKIGIKNNRSILELLLKIVLTAPSDTVKYSASMVFAELASDKMIPALAKYKNSKVEKVRELLPLMIGKLYESNDGSGKEMTQNFFYSVLKDPCLNVKINALLMLHRMGDNYSIEVLKDLFQTSDLSVLSDIILKTIEMDSLDKIYWLTQLLQSENDEIQRSVSLSLTSLLEGESKHKKIIADLVKDIRLEPFKDKEIDEIDSIKETQLDLSKAQEKEKFQFARENTKEMTILFIDITGYTKKSSTMELMEIMNYLKTYEEIAIPIFKSHFGTVVKKMGDGLMLSFPLAIYGALAAIRLQEKLKNYNRFKPEKEKIITRVGLNTGSVAIQGKDLFGDTVNVASRMETKARPGGVLVSESTYHQVKSYVNSEDMGGILVKGKDEPIHSFHILSISTTLPDDMDPLVSGDSAITGTQQAVQTDAKSEIEKIKTLISLGIEQYKSPLNKKLLYNYRVLYKTIEDIKDPGVKERMATLLVNQWQDLKTNHLK